MSTVRRADWEPARRSRKRRRRRKKSRKPLWILLVLICISFAFLVFAYVYPPLCVRKDVTLEAGEPVPDINAFVKRSVSHAKIVAGLDMDKLSVGNYQVEISVFGRKTVSFLAVQDTVAPRALVHDVEIMLGNPVTAMDFVTEITDGSECRVEFRGKPDLTKAGTQNVSILVTDEGDNFTLETAKLTIIEDTEPPVITGVKEQTITVGESVSYKKGVEVSDDIDDTVSLEIDNSAVDTSRIGDYKVIYSATDKAGNRTEVVTTLHVKPKEKKPGEVAQVTSDYVEAEADRILYKILEPDMTQYEVIKAIYDWCHTKIAYYDGAEKVDWIHGAYDGLVNRKGDCYTYAMSAKVLLTRAGIPNKDIEKIPTPTTMHYWNLVDIGEGWHHFDTCRRADKSTFFYKTDAELMEYSNAHHGTHNYDRTIYTDIE